MQERIPAPGARRVAHMASVKHTSPVRGLQMGRSDGQCVWCPPAYLLPSHYQRAKGGEMMHERV